MPNPVTPNHYQFKTHGKELIDVKKICQQAFEKNTLGLTLTEGATLHDTLEYILRADRKEGMEDIKKSIVNTVIFCEMLETRGVLEKHFLLNVVMEKMGTPEEMLKDFMKEDIKVIKELRATVRQFSNANSIIPVKCETTPPTETPFKDALCEYMEEYLEKIKNLRKKIKTIWNKDANNK